MRNIDFRICGRMIVKSFSYNLMSTKIDSNLQISLKKSLTYKYIRNTNINEKELNCGCGCGYALSYQNYIKKYNDNVLDFIFFDKSEAIGYAYVFLKGTKDKILSVNNVDSYISQIEVFSNYRGKGYSKVMIYNIFKELKKINVNNIFLAVNPDNKIAINLYKELGFETQQILSYIRILGNNFPKQII